MLTSSSNYCYFFKGIHSNYDSRGFSLYAVTGLETVASPLVRNICMLYVRPEVLHICASKELFANLSIKCSLIKLSAKDASNCIIKM